MTSEKGATEKIELNGHWREQKNPAAGISGGRAWVAILIASRRSRVSQSY
jgi:hypothetical protein